MTDPISGDRFDEGTALLLGLLEAKIKDGTITASEQLNYIRLLKESGHMWFKGIKTPRKIITKDIPVDEEPDTGHIPFPIQK